VLPVGRIREKVIAARHAGIPGLVLPEANRRDFDKLPDHIRAGLTVNFMLPNPGQQGLRHAADIGGD
jgi:ATP-dependent Lon protease